MNSIFRKTLIASALTVVLSSAAFAQEDYSDTIDGDATDDQRINNQQDRSSTNRPVTDADSDYEDTIDGDASDNQRYNKSNNKSGSGNNDYKSNDGKARSHDMANDGDDDSDRPKSKHQQNVTDDKKDSGGEANYEEEEDSSGQTGSRDRDNENDIDQPKTQHQQNVTEEEEEEEEIMPRRQDGNNSATPSDSERNTESQVGTDRNADNQVGSDRSGAENDYSDDSDMNAQIEDDSNMDNAENTQSDSNLYSMSAEELMGMNVVGNEDEDVGHVSSIVLSNDQTKVFAVISVGSIMGLGGRDVLVPLSELNLVNDDLRIDADENELEEMNDYGSEDFVELEGDADISTAIRPR